MNKKRYNVIVNECRANTCHGCGAAALCDLLPEVLMPPVNFYSQLNDTEKKLVAKAREVD